MITKMRRPAIHCTNIKKTGNTQPSGSETGPRSTGVIRRKAIKRTLETMKRKMGGVSTRSMRMRTGDPMGMNLMKRKYRPFSINSLHKSGKRPPRYYEDSDDDEFVIR